MGGGGFFVIIFIPGRRRTGLLGGGGEGGDGRLVMDRDEGGAGFFLDMLQDGQGSDPGVVLHGALIVAKLGLEFFNLLFPGSLPVEAVTELAEGLSSC